MANNGKVEAQSDENEERMPSSLFILSSLSPQKSKVNPVDA